MDPLTVIDMEFIASTLFPAIDKDILKKMVAFNNQVNTYLYRLLFIFLAVIEPLFSQHRILTNYHSKINHIESQVYSRREATNLRVTVIQFYCMYQ